MSQSTARPEQALAALFEGLTRQQRLALLGRLEMAGGQIYRHLAENEANPKAREMLLNAALDEEKNGAILRGMTTLKDHCEKCHRGLPQTGDGSACSFQCTFCADCSAALNQICPNCAGALESRATLQARL